MYSLKYIDIKSITTDTPSFFIFVFLLFNTVHTVDAQQIPSEQMKDKAPKYCIVLFL